jgi:membrane-associated phospholipid phosphatase
MKTYLRYFGLLFCWLVAGYLRAQAVGDTASVAAPPFSFRPQSYVVPAALVATGLVVQGRISRQLQQRVQGTYPDFRTRSDKGLAFLPGAVSLGLSAAGVQGRHSLGEQVLLAALATVVAQGITQSAKRVIRYPRPDQLESDAFPSGHTTMAFTSATLLHQEYGHRSPWYSVGGYGVATSVAALRLLNNQHWLADVLVGAGVGIGATKAVYSLYPVLKQKVSRRRRSR